MGKEGLIYFIDGELIVESGNVAIYKMKGELFLEIGPGHNLWALESELSDYVHQLKDFPTGDCLEIGLGLGTVSRYILTFPKVKSLTTVEKNLDVIKAHSLISDKDRKHTLDYTGENHTILNSCGLEYAYRTKKTFDFIFIDCYDRIDEDTLPLIKDMVNACKRIKRPNGLLMCWIDKYTPERYLKELQNHCGGQLL